MRFLIFISLFIGALLSISAQTVIFNWAAPQSLTPPFEAPTSTNRYGPYIADSVFTSPEGVTIDIDDSEVKELSQKARFLYGYLTGEVELRVYPSSFITIAAPEKLQIKSVSFAGAKADNTYMEYVGENGEFKGNTWTTSTDGVKSVIFEVKSTINCTSTTVVLTENASVNDITIDHGDSQEFWYNINGIRHDSLPTVKGTYISVRNGKSYKIFIF